MRISFLSLSRRALQIAVILIILAAPLNSLEVATRSQIGNDIGVYNRNFLTELYHSAVERGWISLIYLEKVKGSLWSFDINGYRVSEPLAALEAFASGFTLPLVFVISIIPFLLLTFFLGRVFCSWLCPVSLILECVHKARLLLEKIGMPFKKVNFSYNSKYYVLVFGIIFSFFAGVPLFSIFYPPLVISKQAFLYIYSIPVTGLIIICGIILFEFFISPRSWCRYFCPGGALYSFLGKFRLIGVSVDEKMCTAKEGCTVCFESCGMGLYPAGGNYVNECDNCGKCIVDCPEDAITFKRRFRQ